jgi:hypothetical protein
MIFADTSFLISLYGQDVNTPAAKQQASAHTGPIHVSSINDYEFANALRLLVFRQKITAASRQAQMLAYEADKKAEKIIFRQSNTNDVFTKAELLSIRHTETLGNLAQGIVNLVLPCYVTTPLELQIPQLGRPPLLPIPRAFQRLHIAFW